MAWICFSLLAFSSFDMLPSLTCASVSTAVSLVYYAHQPGYSNRHCRLMIGGQSLSSGVK